jgi:hypothetical protein
MIHSVFLANAQHTGLAGVAALLGAFFHQLSSTGNWFRLEQTLSSTSARSIGFGQTYSYFSDLRDSSLRRLIRLSSVSLTFDC